MKRRYLYKKIILVILTFITIISLGKVKATNLSEIDEEYSEEYKQWLELSDEEKKTVIEPRKYDLIQTHDNSMRLKNMNNVLKVSQLLRGTTISQYTLQTIIPDNVKIRNQKSTNSCWAFATIGVLESNLAMQDKLASKPVTIYDFSEKHMNYATARNAFKNGQINENGFNRNISDGGNFYHASAYLTNGSGAIPEEELPFVDSEEPIDIEEIKNKTIATTLYDTIEFAKPKTDEAKQETITRMKEHITNYGGIYATIHSPAFGSDNYNNETGAIYCDNSLFNKTNHAVMIIGWDDNYPISNFNERTRPNQAGAWIIKNSYGESETKTILEWKIDLYNSQTEQCNANGWHSPEEIPNEIIINSLKASYSESKVTIDGDNISVEIGNKGYMYISYEDINVYSSLVGIEKSVATKDYFNIYQNDPMGSIREDYNYCRTIRSADEVGYIANVFTREPLESTMGTEYLKRVSIYTTQGYTCKVYVNPNNDSKALEDLQEVKLAAGETETFDAGYHTIEFAESIPLKGDKFVVVIAVVDHAVLDPSSSYANKFIYLSLENTLWDENVIVNEGESFFCKDDEINKNRWEDLVNKGNVCIKAFTTVGKVSEIVLDDIEIEKAPTKTIYTEGENFDKTGMVVIARYNNSPREEITNYTVIDGESLTVGKNSVTISYTYNGVTKTATQSITVNPKTTPTPTPDENKNPVNSDFTNVSANIINAQLYFYTDDIDKSYSTMQIKISNIKIGDEDNQYTYYYYLSGTQGITNIPTDAWKKAEATKENNGTYSITIDINTQNIKNIDELVQSENLFLYLKEIAEINDESKESINTLEINGDNIEPIIYVNDKKVGSIDEVLEEIKNSQNKNEGNNNEQEDDETIAQKIIPKAGMLSITIILLVIMSIIGIVSYYKFKNIDR